MHNPYGCPLRAFYSRLLHSLERQPPHNKTGKPSYDTRKEDMHVAKEKLTDANINGMALRRERFQVFEIL